MTKKQILLSIATALTVLFAVSCIGENVFQDTDPNTVANVAYIRCVAE